MKKSRLLAAVCAIALVLSTGAQMAQAALYDVTGVFNEPMLANDTNFIGTFDWDTSTNTLSSLQGTMNASMYGADQIYSLTNQFDFSYDANTGDVVASVFKENSTDVFDFGGFLTGDTNKYGATDGNTPNENVYFTLAFNANTMTEILDLMVYGDCAPTGLMGPMMTGNVCMTGHSLGGTMSATPLSLSITPSAVPVPAAVWLFGSGLLGLVGMARRKA